VLAMTSSSVGAAGGVSDWLSGWLSVVFIVFIGGQRNSTQFNAI
jgi:hypothetical protein